MTVTHRSSLERELAATAALATYSLAVAFGFSRVFSGWQFMADLALLVIVGHGSSFALRRAGVSGWLAVPATTALLVWTLILQHYRSTTTLLIPRGRTWETIDRDIALVRDQFRTAVAPVLYDQVGWAVLAGFALVVTIAMSDAFAFRAEARGEALVPGGVLFVFISALSSARLRLVSTAVLIGAGVLVVVALRALHDRRRRVELTAASGPVSLTAMAAGATAVTLAVLAGFVGPRIPGADADPLYDTRTGGGSTSTVVNPLVDIRSRLTNRSNEELFLVNADQISYWRSTTLAEFDGDSFTQPTSPAAELAPAGSGGNANRQRILVRALGGQFIPAAAEVVNGQVQKVTGQIEPIQRVAGTGAVTVAPVRDLQSGDVIDVVSVNVAPSTEQLRAATASSPPDPIYLELPSDLPPIVSEKAFEVTAGATTPYDQAVALEAWMQDFEYSLEVQASHNNSAIETFLEIQVGYCEQFSATFAAMARTLGIPSRVAVGFTWGVESDDPNNEGFRSVRGKNAHAWPELWFDGIGWVAFEPTPGRGIPGADYSTVEPAQDESPPETVGPGEGGFEQLPIPSTPETLVPPTTVATDPSASTVPSADTPDLLPDGGVDVPSGDGSPATSSSGVPWRTLVIVALLVAALAAPALIRRWRARSARHHGPAERVEAAWTRACSAAERAGVRGRPSMTTQEWAAATAAELPVASRPMHELADVVDKIEFAPPDTIDLSGPGSLGSTLGDDCDAWALQVSRISGDTLTAPQRVRHYFTNLN